MSESKYTLKLMEFDKNRSVIFTVTLVTKKVSKKRAGEIFKDEIKKYECVFSKKKKNWCYMITNSEGNIFGMENLK